MEPLSENRIVLITRQTRLDELLARFNTYGQAKFYVEHLDADFSDYEREDETYKAALQRTREHLQSLGRVQILSRSFLPNFIFGKKDTVVVLGQDGLVANTLKYLDGQPVVAINPDPARWDGVLLPFTVPDIPQVIPEVFAGARPLKEITMAKAELNTGQVLYGVNDLFIGPQSHISARYLLEVNGKKEPQSSSGIIVSTGLGSSGWFKSILAGAKGIAGCTLNQRAEIDKRHKIGWGSDYLYYTVREPFPSKTSQATLVFGKIAKDKPMHVVSQMPEHGVIFSDGIEIDFLEFNSGTHAKIGVAEKKGFLTV